MSLEQCVAMARLHALLIKTYIMFVVISVLFSVTAVHGTPKKINYREKEKEILDHIFGSTYDSKIRPSGVNETGPTEVTVNFYVRSIDKIDDYSMEYSVQLTFREKWLDDRLRFDTLNAYRELDSGKLRYLTLKDPARIWMPDLFFSNEKQGHQHNLLLPNVYFRISPNGEVLFSNRLSLTLSCPMIFKLYPLDKQSCSIRMASYSFTTEDVLFRWESTNPVQLTRQLQLPQYALEQFTSGYCHSQTNTGTYSCIRVDFQFKREFSYYFTQFYIPCIILVIASWISFWLDERAAPERASLGVTVLLTMVTQTSGINENLPPVSYTKALDVWTAVCLVFVFGALLEFALINYYSRLYQPPQKETKEQRQGKSKHTDDLESAGEPDGENSEDDSIASGTSFTRRRTNEENAEIHRKMEPKEEGCARSWLSKYPSRSKRIDLVSRILFPLLFALFNIAYWLAYLSRHD